MVNDKSRRRRRRRKFNVKDQLSRCLNNSVELQNFDQELDLINAPDYNRKTRRNTSSFPCNKKYVIKTDLRLDKPGRHCVASSGDGSWFVFMDTITNKNYSVSEYFLWNQRSKIKVLLPRLPATPESFLKCIVNVGTNRSHPTVIFFYKNAPAYMCPSKGFKNWDVYYYSDARTIYCDAVCLESSCDDITFCAVTRAGTVYRSIGSMDVTLDSPNMSILYQRRLVVDYGNQGNDHCRVFLLERRARTIAWEVWEVDFSCEKFVRVDNLAGKAILLSGNYTVVCNSEILGNCICFTLDGDNDNFYVFRLAGKTTSIFPNQPYSGFPVWFPNLTDPGLRWLRFVEKDVENNANPEEPEEKVAEVMPVYSQESIYFNLPDDILRLVVEYVCSTMDYANFRMVCRNWREIARPIYWKHNISNMESPWLMSFDDSNACASFLDPTCNMRFYSTIEELSGCKIWYSKDGWLLVTRFPTVFFFEPFSKTKISVPDFPTPFSVDWMSISSPPTSSDWIIIATLSSWVGMKVRCIKSGDNNWSLCFGVEHQETCLTPVCPPVFHSGRFCCLGQNRSLTIFNFEGPEVRSGHILTTDESFDLSPQYLVPCEENLYLVVMGPFRKYVNVYMMDVGAHKWEEVKDLDTFSFFISQTSSFAIRTTKDGGINFPLFVENCHLSYKLDTSEFRCHSKHAEMEMNERNELSFSTWIQPNVIRAYR